MVCCRCRWETSYQKGAVYEFEPDYRGIVCADCALVLRMYREEAVAQATFHGSSSVGIVSTTLITQENTPTTTTAKSKAPATMPTKK